MSRSPDPFLLLGNSAAKGSPAPKGRNIPAQGNALGSRHPTNPSPEGAAQGWRIAKISEFAKTTSGGTPSRKNPEFYTGNITWMKSGDLNDGYVSEATEFITEEVEARTTAIDHLEAKFARSSASPISSTMSKNDGPAGHAQPFL